MDLKITPSGQTIVKPTALGPGANTDTKLLIYGLFQKGRVLAQDGVVLSCVGQTDLGGHGGRAEEIRLVDEGPTIAEINAVALRVAAEAQAKANAASAGKRDKNG